MSDFAPEVPNAIVVAAHPSNYRARPSGLVTPYSLGVQHITSGHADPIATARMWQCPAGSKGNPRGASATFVIGPAATIVQCVPLRFAAQHAHHEANGISYGVEHSAREPGEFSATDPGMPLTPEQLKASAWLNAYLMKAAGITPARHLNIKGHAEADPTTTHTKCPDGVAGGWPWDDYMAMMMTEWNALGSIRSLVA